MRQIVLVLTVMLVASFGWLSTGLLRWAAQAEEVAGNSEDVPAPIAAAATAYLDECKEFGSSPVPTEAFVETVDLNDDGESDYIIDTDEINASCFCGSGGCTIEAWVSDGGDYVKALESNVRQWQVSSKAKLPPVLVVDLHGTSCGGVGADLCLKALIYQDGQMVGSAASE